MSDDYYMSFAKQKSFKCLEKCFRLIQATLLLFMVFCFIYYLITFGIDIKLYCKKAEYLAPSLVIDLVALLFIGLGIRGVAFEVFPIVIIFTIVIILVTIAHGVTFIYRHPGLNGSNFVFDLLLSIYAIIYTVLLCRFDRMKPNNYDELLARAAESETIVSEAVNSTTCPLTSDIQTEFSDFKSHTESRLTELGTADISCSGIDSGRAPIANFTTSY